MIIFATIILKLFAGFFIGSLVGRVCAKNDFSIFVGVIMTIVTVLIACLLIDVVFGK